MPNETTRRAPRPIHTPADYGHPIIAREGWPFIAIAVALSAAVTFWAGAAWSLPLWLITVFVVQFFRDPGRVPPKGDNLVVVPADGRVIVVEHTQDPYFKRDAIKVSVFMNVFNVHSNRSPIDGTILAQQYFPGQFFNAALDKASERNERNMLRLRAANGQELTCVQIAGLVARRILCYVKPGDALAAGQRYGFIRFGSRVDLYLPTDARVKVAIGDVVTAGKDVLAELA